MTYEAVTSLNVHLANLSTSSRSPVALSSTLGRLIKDGLGVAEDAFLFSILPAGFSSYDDSEGSGIPSVGYVCNGISNSSMAKRARIEIVGDVFAMKQESLDLALWKIGGAPIMLRLVEVASVSGRNDDCD